MGNEFIIRNGGKVLTNGLSVTGQTDIDGNLNITGNTNMTGSLTASSKSFDIPHPTKDGWRLRYGVLEGPEHGVYFRGSTQVNVIELPSYWIGLINEKSITVQLTPIENSTIHFVVKVENNKIYVDSDSGNVNCYFTINAERKDIDKVLLEYQIHK